MFDEELYLEANPDVAAAVQSGALPSGDHHYRNYGWQERRALRPGVRPSPSPLPFPEDLPLSRRDKVLAGLELALLRGVEIGPLRSPLVSKAEGDVTYVDHADTETLKRKYAGDTAINVDELVEVDGVWGENTLLDCVGGDFDFVTASHVVEHVPDLVTWLLEIHAILKPGGALRLAIPDRRYTFDYYRFESRLHDVLDAYVQKARRPLPRLVLEHFSRCRIVDTGAIWNGEAPPPFTQSLAAVEAGLNMAKDTILNGSYHDTHCWVFTPESFAGLMEDLATMGLLPFRIDRVIDTAVGDFEFFVHLTAV